MRDENSAVDDFAAFGNSVRELGDAVTRDKTRDRGQACFTSRVLYAEALLAHHFVGEAQFRTVDGCSARVQRPSFGRFDSTDGS